MEDFDNKETVKKVLACFKRAGADLTKIPNVSNTPTQAEFQLNVKGKDVTIDIDFKTGDVFYKDFTTKNLLGNIAASDKLTQSISKQFFTDKEVTPNAESQEDKMNKLKEMVKSMIRKHLDEESSTGGGASMAAGAGEQYATPKAFAPNNKRKELLNRAGRYLIKQGYKPVSDKTRFDAKSFDVEKWH